MLQNLELVVIVYPISEERVVVCLQYDRTGFDFLYRSSAAHGVNDSYVECDEGGGHSLLLIACGFMCFSPGSLL